MFGTTLSNDGQGSTIDPGAYTVDSIHGFTVSYDDSHVSNSSAYTRCARSTALTLACDAVYQITTPIMRFPATRCVDQYSRYALVS